MRNLRRSPAAPIIIIVVLAGCSAPGPSASAPETDGLASPSPVAATQTVESDEAARDIDQLISTLDSVHPNAWHGIDREDFVAALDGYEADYTPDEAVVELMRVVALLSRQGRDGHQFAVPCPAARGRRSR
jgi:hypothetical protein